MKALKTALSALAKSLLEILQGTDPEALSRLFNPDSVHIL